MDELDMQDLITKDNSYEWKPENIVSRLIPVFAPNVVLHDGTLARVYTHRGSWGIIMKTREEPCRMNIHELAAWLNANHAQSI